MLKIIIASGPVIIENNKVLLVQHGDTKFWKFCGGKVDDFDHNLIDHARREVKEEMDLQIHIENTEPCLLYTPKEITDGKLDVILVHYLAKRSGEIKPGADIRQWSWIPLKELAGMEKRGELAPNIIPALQHFGKL